MASIGIGEVRVTVTVTPARSLAADGKVSSFCMTG